MPCYRPLSASLHYDPGSRKRTVSFGKTENYDAAKILDLPCGQCIGCRLERSRRWAVRLMHEAQLHDRSCFVTLTYDNKHVPKDGSLDVSHFQLFMKRLRRGSTGPLRFFHCGEYGETTKRPHYHAILFGTAFDKDRRPDKKTPQGHILFSSPTLDKAWGNGHAWIGELTFESAAYVARYCLKKINGEQAEAHYQGRRPEYVTMSRRPGIGSGWYDRFKEEVYPSDSVVLRGKEMMPPPFYDKILERNDPELFARIKRERHQASEDQKWSPETTTSRLHIRETVQAATVSQTLKRKL